MMIHTWVNDLPTFLGACTMCTGTRLDHPCRFMISRACVFINFPYIAHALAARKLSHKSTCMGFLGEYILSIMEKTSLILLVVVWHFSSSVCSLFPDIMDSLKDNTFLIEDVLHSSILFAMVRK